MLILKKIQEAIGKTSSLIQLTTKGGTEGLTKSVMAATKLGTSLDKVMSISEGLLDFEQSIAAEMEAEMLLGKEINLEKARQADFRG